MLSSEVALREPVEAVVLGASAGAIEALGAILPRLPETFPAAVCVVVHVPPEDRSLLPELFAPRCKLPVQEAEDKAPVAPGNIYFAPPDYHLLIERNHHFSLSVDEQVNFSRPSIDVLFETAALAYGEKLVGISLTGANADGALGLLAIRRAGGQIIAQDPETADYSIMPEAAVTVAQPELILTLDQIASVLEKLRAKESQP